MPVEYKIELAKDYSGIKPIFPIIKKLFKGEKPKSIFEVGCGVGLLFLDYVLENKKIESVGGFDIEPEYIRGARMNFRYFRENFFVWDANKIPWPLEDRSIDIIFTVGTLLVIPDVLPVLKEMVRIGNKVLIAELHDEKADAYGVPIETDSVYTYRIKRNYFKLFKELGLKCKIKGFDEDSGKTIFEYKHKRYGK